MAKAKRRAGRSRAAGERKARKTPFLDSLEPGESRVVLDRLLAAHPDLRGEAEETARSVLGGISFESVADEVESAVGLVDEDAIYGRAGRHDWGYVEPDEAAGEVLEEAVAPFLEKMRRCKALGLDDAALELCKGIVLGLYRQRDSEASDVLEYGRECLEEMAADAIQSWSEREGERRPAGRRRPGGPVFPKEFVKEYIPEWNSWISTTRR